MLKTIGVLSSNKGTHWSLYLIVNWVRWQTSLLSARIEYITLLMIKRSSRSRLTDTPGIPYITVEYNSWQMKVASNSSMPFLNVQR